MSYDLSWKSNPAHLGELLDFPVKNLHFNKPRVRIFQEAPMTLINNWKVIRNYELMDLSINMLHHKRDPLKVGNMTSQWYRSV